MSKKILAIAGSARRGGNSDTILHAATEVLEGRGAEVERIVPRQLMDEITPCRSCWGCWNTGECVVQDRMQDLYVRFSEVDHIVVCSPVYFTSVPGHLKVLIDRFQCFWVRTFRMGEPPEPKRQGMFLSVGAMDREEYFQCCRKVIGSWYACLNMKTAVSRFFPGLDEKDDIHEHPDYLTRARRAAGEFMDLAGE
jgi:multimeric flavodoxin WrbA